MRSMLVFISIQSQRKDKNTGLLIYPVFFPVWLILPLFAAINPCTASATLDDVPLCSNSEEEKC